jgi:hypothetical protein
MVKDVSHLIPKYGKPDANPKDWFLTEEEQIEISEITRKRLEREAEELNLRRK